MPVNTCFWCKILTVTLLGAISSILFVVSLKVNYQWALSQEHIRFRKGFPSQKNWIDSPYGTLKSYLFNVTNGEAFLNGTDAKLKLEEIGPIVYRIKGRNEILNQTDDTLTYQKLPYEDIQFDPIASCAPDILNQTIILPNFILFGTAAKFHDWVFLVRHAFNAITINEPVLIKQSIYYFLWNFTTPALSSLSSYVPNIVSNCGMLHNALRKKEEIYNVKIGDKNGVDNFFQVNTLNNKTYFPEQSNRLRFVKQKKYYTYCPIEVPGTFDNSLFTPFLDPERELTIIASEACRTHRLTYSDIAYHLGFRGYRYTIADNAEESSCLDNAMGIKLHKGMFDVSKCLFNDVPSAFSSPHFYGSTYNWSEHFEGLSPNQKDHEATVIIEPITGIPIEEKYRFQSNIPLPDMSGYSKELQRFSKMVIPTFWYEYEAAMQGRKHKFCTKLYSTYLRKWWITIAIAICFLILGILVTCEFTALVNLIINYQVALRPGSQTFGWWAKPPVEPKIQVYVYNVTNANEFLNNASKPILDEVGPYVYTESWEKVNIVENENGTLSYNLRKIYTFREELSVGMEDDVVIVPNIPMLSATSQSKHAARFLRLAMASIMDILKIKPFVQVSVGQLLWGYEDPLLKLAKDVVPKEQKLPYEEFGLMYGKNGTSADRVTIFTGVDDITQYGIIDKYNGRSFLPHWLSDDCNRLNGTDGSIFPPHIDTNRVLYIYDKDLCRLLPLVYEKEVEAKKNVIGYRFTPPQNVFSDVESNPDNMCFCPAGPPSCSPNGLFNVSLCQYDSPIMLSFPHFYLGDESLLTAVEGITPPEKEKHGFFIDVHPTLGTTLRARARVQINLAVSQVFDIKQVANFPDIVFPILWFEEGIEGLPDEITDLMSFAETVPPKIRLGFIIALFVLGASLLLLSLFCLIRSSHRQSTLHLEGSNYLATAQFDLTKKKAKEPKH